MALATLPVVIDRPITDKRIMTELVKSYPAVKNWWSTVQPLAYLDPNSGLYRFKPRIGNDELVGIDRAQEIPWAAEGNWQAANFILGGGGPFPGYGFQTPALTGIWSMFSLSRCRATGGSNEEWGLWTGPTSGSGPNIYSIPNRFTSVTLQFADLDGDPTDNVALGATTTNLDAKFWTVNFDDGAVQGAVNGNTPTAGSFPGWAIVQPTFGPGPWTWDIGRGRLNQPFDGTITDFMLVQGDIFTMTELHAALVDYAATAYQV